LLGVALSWGATFADALEISVVSRKNEYVVGEPVVIRVTQKNLGEDVAYASDMLEAGNGGYYDFSSDGTNYSRIVALEMGDPVRGGVSLDQGQSYVYDEVIAYTDEPSGPVFGKPGCYRVRVHDSWVSESFRVVAPTNALDVAAAAAFTDSEVLRCVTPWYRDGAGVSGSGKKKLAGIARMRSPSISFHAASSLAEIALESSDPTEALKWAEIADVDGFVLRDRVVYFKGVAYLRLLQIDKAQAQFDRIEKEFPDSATACMLKRDGQRLMAEAKRALARQSKDEKAKNEAARWKDAPAATRKEIEQTVDTLMKKFMTLDERGSSGMMTDNFVMNGHCTKAQLLERFRRELKEAKEKLPIVSTVFEQVVTDGSNVIAQMEFTFRSEGRERKKRDRMTFVQKGNKGVWLLAIWDSTPVDSPEMKKWEEQVIRMSIEGNTNNIPERPRPRTY
jgi:hypothetical protein